MPSIASQNNSARLGGGGFPTTHWSVVLAASQTDLPVAQEALGHLCRTYWYPVYSYVRWQGYPPADAEDLTQTYFARLLQNRSLALADQERGRFRTFLLTSLRNFLINEWAKQRTKRRGGGRRMIEWDALDAEARFAVESALAETPETAYERRWAATLLEQVLKTLRKEAVASGRQPLFEKLIDYLWGESSQTSYRSIAGDLGMNETAVKGAAHRLRQRFRELLRAEIAHTVVSHEEIEDELRHLHQVISA